MAIVEMARRERGAPAIRRASASLTGLRAGRVPQPERAGRHDRTTRAGGAPGFSAASTVPRRETAIGETRPRRRRRWRDRRANASLTGLRAARVPQPATGRPPRSDDRSGGPRERRFDRPEAKRDGDRRERPPRTRGAGDPARERKFDRPQGRTRPPAGEGRPPRSEDKSRGPRSDFKSRPPRTGARDGDRPQSPSRGAGGKGGPPRGRSSSPGGRPPPRKGPPKGAGGPRRPPRKP